MKPKFLDVLAVSFITLIVLSPALLTFGFVWHQHLHLIQDSVSHTASSLQATAQSAASKSLCYVSPELKQYWSIADIEIAANYLAKTIAFITMGLFLMFPLYSGYRVYRTMIFKQKVMQLERLWQQGIQH
jgi:hypothetical protein